MKMNMKKTILGGIAAVLPLILLSPVFNLFLFEHWVESVEFQRPFMDFRSIPGMPLITLAWGMILSLAYQKIHQSIGGSGLRKGVNFGLFIFLVMFPFAELFNYALYQLPFMVVVSGLLHNLVSLPLGGLLLHKILEKELD